MKQTTTVVVVAVVDSHIQRIVLATEETTVTQQVGHRPIKCQSRSRSQRGTKVNGSHHGDNPLLRPTGIQIATKSMRHYKQMAPANVKTVHQTSLLYNIYQYGEQPRSTRNVVAYPQPAFSATKRTSCAPTSLDQQVRVSQDHTSYINKGKKWNTEVHGGGGLEVVKLAREPASSHRRPCASLESPTNLSHSPLLVGPVGTKLIVVGDHIFPQKPPGSRL